MYVCANETLAKDAVQNSFTSVFKYLSSFRFDSSFKTWLLRIVHNESCRIMKQETKYQWTEYEEELKDWRDITFEAEVPINSKELKHEIANVLVKMKHVEALVLKLFYLEEMSMKEITEIMNCTLGNVKVLLYRARKSFKTWIESSNLAEYNERG